MALTNVKIQNAKAKGKPYKLYDEMGLYVLIQPTGSKLWNFKYRYLAKEKKLSFGAYPGVSLKEARRLRADAKVLLNDGVDPSREKKKILAAAMLGQQNTFNAIGTECLERMALDGCASVTIKKITLAAIAHGARYWLAARARRYAS